jgi:hypothetical protein
MARVLCKAGANLCSELKAHVDRGRGLLDHLDE